MTTAAPHLQLVSRAEAGIQVTTPRINTRPEQQITGIFKGSPAHIYATLLRHLSGMPNAAVTAGAGEPAAWSIGACIDPLPDYHHVHGARSGRHHAVLPHRRGHGQRSQRDVRTGRGTSGCVVPEQAGRACAAPLPGVRRAGNHHPASTRVHHHRTPRRTDAYRRQYLAPRAMNHQYMGRVLSPILSCPSLLPAHAEAG